MGGGAGGGGDLQAGDLQGIGNIAGFPGGQHYLQSCAILGELKGARMAEQLDFFDLAGGQGLGAGGQGGDDGLFTGPVHGDGVQRVALGGEPVFFTGVRFVGWIIRTGWCHTGSGAS